jgi:hypothetical protein
MTSSAFMNVSSGDVSLYARNSSRMDGRIFMKFGIGVISLVLGLKLHLFSSLVDDVTVCQIRVVE